MFKKKHRVKRWIRFKEPSQSKLTDGVSDSVGQKPVDLFTPDKGINDLIIIDITDI